MPTIISNTAFIGTISSNTCELELIDYTFTKTCNGTSDKMQTQTGAVNEYEIVIANAIEGMVTFDDPFTDIIDANLAIDVDSIMFNSVCASDSYDAATRTITIELPDLAYQASHVITFTAVTMPSKSKSKNK